MISSPVGSLFNFFLLFKSYDILFDSTGLVNVIQIRLSKQHKSKKTRSHDQHKGNKVTSMVWKPDGTKLFMGSDKGLVTAMNFHSSKVMQAYSNFFMFSWFSVFSFQGIQVFVNSDTNLKTPIDNVCFLPRRAYVLIRQIDTTITLFSRKIKLLE